MKAAGIIFSETKHSALDALTHCRTVASLPFGSRYRLIDFVLSNMVNSGINNIGVITKSNYQSLMDHLGTCQEWDLNRKNGGLMIIPPFAAGVSGNYDGRLDKLSAALKFIDERCSEDYMILADCAIVCKLDYAKILESHISSGKDLTVVAMKVVRQETKPSELVLDMDDRGKVTGVYINYIAKPGQYVSLGRCVIGRKYLRNVVTYLTARGYHSFAKDFVQQDFNNGSLDISVYVHDGLAMRNHDIKDYFENSLALTDKEVQDTLFDMSRPVYTTVHDEVPTFYGNDSSVSDSLFADGCEINGKVEHSVLFRGVIIEKGASVRNSVIMDASVVEEGASLENVIIDKNVRISRNTHIKGAPADPLIISKGETV